MKLKNRRAFLLPGVLVLIFVLLVLAGSRLLFSRNHLATVLRLTDQERAFQVAASALTVATEIVDRCLLVLNLERAGADNAIPDDLYNLAQALRGKETLLQTEQISYQLKHPLFEYLQQTEKPDKLSVQVCLSPPEALFSVGGKIHMDSQELRQAIQIRASVRFNNGRSTVVTFKILRVVSIQVPVIGKFALYLRKQGPLQINAIKDSQDPSKINDLPIVVHSGKTLGSGELLSNNEATIWFDKQGWVSLGGSSQWKLNLSKCGGNPNFEDALTRDGRSSLPIEGKLSAGVKLAYFTRQCPLFAELAKTILMFLLFSKFRIFSMPSFNSMLSYTDASILQ